MSDAPPAKSDAQPKKQKPAAILLVHRIPYPPNKGDKIRSWHLLKHLARDYAVHLCAFVDDPDDMRYQSALEAVCASVSLVPLNSRIATLRSAQAFFRAEPQSFSYYRDGRMIKALKAARASAPLIEVAFSSSMAPYLDHPQTEGARPVRVIDFCDSDAEKWREYAPSAPWPLRLVYAREGRRLAAAETTLANASDVSFAISPAEAALFNNRATMKTQVGWFSNGVDLDFFSPSSVQSLKLPPPFHDHAPDLVFVGAMDYRANIEAVQFFVGEVFGALRAQHPQLRFAIVGANPTSAVRALGAHEGVFVTGRVDDVRPWLAAAQMSVAPLSVARGMQNKVLEAMAMAKPVIASSGAATGIKCTPGHDILVADTPKAYLDQANALLAQPAFARKIGAAARARVEHDYAWGQQFERFDAALGEALAKN